MRVKFSTKSIETNTDVDTIISFFRTAYTAYKEKFPTDVSEQAVKGVTAYIVRGIQSATPVLLSSLINKAMNGRRATYFEIAEQEFKLSSEAHEYYQAFVGDVHKKLIIASGLPDCIKRDEHNPELPEGPAGLLLLIQELLERIVARILSEEGKIYGNELINGVLKGFIQALRQADQKIKIACGLIKDGHRSIFSNQSHSHTDPGAFLLDLRMQCDSESETFEDELSSLSAFVDSFKETESFNNAIELGIEACYQEKVFLRQRVIVALHYLLHPGDKGEFPTALLHRKTLSETIKYLAREIRTKFQLTQSAALIQRNQDAVDSMMIVEDLMGECSKARNPDLDKKESKNLQKMIRENIGFEKHRMIFEKLFSNLEGCRNAMGYLFILSGSLEAKNIILAIQNYLMRGSATQKATPENLVRNATITTSERGHLWTVVDNRWLDISRAIKMMSDPRVQRRMAAKGLSNLQALIEVNKQLHSAQFLPEESDILAKECLERLLLGLQMATSGNPYMYQSGSSAPTQQEPPRIAQNSASTDTREKIKDILKGIAVNRGITLSLNNAYSEPHIQRQHEAIDEVLAKWIQGCLSVLALTEETEEASLVILFKKITSLEDKAVFVEIKAKIHSCIECMEEMKDLINRRLEQLGQVHLVLADTRSALTYGEHPEIGKLSSSLKLIHETLLGYNKGNTHQYRFNLSDPYSEPVLTTHARDKTHEVRSTWILECLRILISGKAESDILSILDQKTKHLVESQIYQKYFKSSLPGKTDIEKEVEKISLIIQSCLSAQSASHPSHQKSANLDMHEEQDLKPIVLDEEKNILPSGQEMQKPSVALPASKRATEEVTFQRSQTINFENYPSFQPEGTMPGEDQILTSQRNKDNLLAMAAHVKKGFESITPVNPADIGLLLLGSTGSGKSMITNYCLETPLVRWDLHRHGDHELINGVKYKRMHGHIYPASSHALNQDLPQMGDDSSSKTEQIKGYPTKHGLIIDTPGFFETDPNKKLANALTLEHLVTQSEKIRLAVVVEYGALETGKSPEFKNLTKLLGRLFRPDFINPSKCPQCNTVFLFNDKAGRRLTPPILRQAIKSVVTSLESERKTKVTSEDIDTVDATIQLCEAITRTPDQYLISVNPLDKGASRQAIFQAIGQMQPADTNLFTFNLHEMKGFRDHLRETFIERHLYLLRRENFFYDLRNINTAHYSKLSAYAQLTTEARRTQIEKDLVEYREALSKTADLLDTLNTNLVENKKQLTEMNPDDEIEFMTMTGDHRSYTFVEKYGTPSARIVTVGGASAYALASSFGPASLAAVLSTSTSGVTIVTGVGAISVTSPIAAAAVATATVSLPIAACAGLIYLAIKGAERYLEDRPFKVSYEGATFTRAEIRRIRTNPAENEKTVFYYQIVDREIVASADKQHCTAMFQRKSGVGPQESETICLLGKKENHPAYAPIIIELRQKIAELNKEIIKHEQLKINTEEIINILEKLLICPDQTTLQDLIKQFTMAHKSQDQTNWKKSFDELNRKKDEIEAVLTILDRLPMTPAIAESYLSESSTFIKRISMLPSKLQCTDLQNCADHLFFQSAMIGASLNQFNRVEDTTHLSHQNVLWLIARSFQLNGYEEGLVFPATVTVLSKDEPHTLRDDILKFIGKQPQQDRMSIALCLGQLNSQTGQIEGDTHWAALHLRRISSAKGVELKISYMDSLETGNVILDHVRAALDAVAKGMIDDFPEGDVKSMAIEQLLPKNGSPKIIFSAPESLPCQKQTDSYSCGYHAVFNMLRMHNDTKEEAVKQEGEIINFQSFMEDRRRDLKQHFNLNRAAAPIPAAEITIPTLG